MQAPFAHEHPDDPHHSHADGLMHGHFGQVEHDDDHFSEHDQTALDHDEAEEATIWLSWFPNTEPRVEIASVLDVGVAEFKPETVSVDVVPEFEPQAHSPPLLSSIPPRAPPA